MTGMSSEALDAQESSTFSGPGSPMDTGAIFLSLASLRPAAHENTAHLVKAQSPSGARSLLRLAFDAVTFNI